MHFTDELSSDSQLNCGEIRKKILSPGIKEPPKFIDGSKVLFHFCTQKCDESGTIIDDTHKYNRPMELLLGKKFKLEVWEKCIATMNLKEIAEFTVEKSLVTEYPTVSKMVRVAFGPKDQHSHHEHEESHPHCCGMMALKKEKMFDDDLEVLVQHPQNLKFTFELLEVNNPGEYEKDGWQMNDNEKLASLPKLKDEGNHLEKPRDTEWMKLEEMKIPYLLNYAQCKLLTCDYYPVIEHTTAVLEHDPVNVKALYRRALGHIGAWNPDAARADLNKILTVDQSMSSLVNKKLATLDELIKQKNDEDKAKLAGKLF
ncbi:hypothetical protein CHUAL_005752 [Chamberlinius hualienensis]